MFRLWTYNLLNWSNPSEQRARAFLHVVLGTIPEILVVQGIDGIDGVRAIGDQLHSYSKLIKQAPFTDGPDTDNAMFYYSGSVTVIAHDTIPGIVRHIDVWTVAVNATYDTVHIICCHLKAGDTEADRNDRYLEAELIRAWTIQIHTMTPNHHYMLVGDLNVYTSEEPAYQDLTYISSAGGELIDPIDRPGNWHDDSTFANIHTHSTRVRQFGGGTGGGLNDRFDFILVSPSLRGRTGYYITIGNDGNHFKDSINYIPNKAVDSGTAQSLHDASDHLPVQLELYFNYTDGVEEEESLPLEMNLSERK